MEFQLTSIHGYDNTDDEDNNKYVINLFGRTNEGKTVSCCIDFQPYFYVEVPTRYSKVDVLILLDTLPSYIRKNIDSHKLLKRKKLYGFTNDEVFKFMKFSFRTHEQFKRTYYYLRKVAKYKTKIYEANIDPILRFMHIQDLTSTGWVRIEKQNYDIVGNKETCCTLELSVDDWKHIHPFANDTIGPIVTASFDIETYSADGSFPDPKSKRNECPAFQISTVYHKFGDKVPYKKILHSFGTCDPIDGVDVVECETEKDMIIRWIESVREEDPDILTGYNIWKFDLKYLYQRSEKMNIECLFNLTRYLEKTSTMKIANFSSSAYGDNEYYMVSSEGRIQIDLLELIKREHKLVKYSLNAVSEHFIGNKKVDMPIPTMFAKFKGSSSDRRDVGIYCIHDSDLVLQLILKLNNIPNLIEMAKATFVPMNYLLERGQQIKVFSQLLKQTRMDGMLVYTNTEDKKNDSSFVGATVLSAQTGAYMDRVVTGLDFASLYPSIMRAHNLCYNTIVLEDKYANMDGVTYETIEWDTNGVTQKYKFAQNTQGILPKILENLALNRKQAKRDMAKASDRGDLFMKDVYNGKQLAFKVSMNSIYGFCAAFMLPCQPISACVTTIGRNMIEKTKLMVETEYPGSEVIYGDTDSVMVIFKTGKETDGDMIKESFRMGKEAASRISSTFKNPIELEFEKCYYPYLLFSKKRYAGLMYTNPDKPDYIDAKGIQLVRRDNTQFVKEVSSHILNLIMYERKVLDAMEYVQDQAYKLLRNEIPIDKLIVSKTLSKEYKNDKQPHLEVARKMKARLPGSEPKCGERVPYVFIEIPKNVANPNQKVLQYEKAEDPEYVKVNKLTLDVMYYLEHSLSSPIESVFSLFIDNPGKTLFSDVIQAYNQQKK